MKICFFTENSIKGGLDTFIINLVNSWEITDDITLICNENHPGLKTIEKKIRRKISFRKYNYFFSSIIPSEDNNFNIWNFRVVRAIFHIIFRIIKYPILVPYYIFVLRRLFRNSEYEYLMVVNGGYPGSILCRCALIGWNISGKSNKGILNIHNFSVKPNIFNVFFESIIDKMVARAASFVVSVSDPCLQSLINRASFFEYKNRIVIHNGIEDPILSLKKGVPRITNRRYCLMLATYESRKGHLFLLDSFKLVLNILPDLELHFFGHGKKHQISLIKQKIVELGIEKNVYLHDFENDSASLILNSELVLVPSQSFESFGLTIIEAMALNKPIIVTNVGGMPEVIGTSNSGIICSKDNPKEFSDAIIKVLVSQSLSQELGLNGRHHFEENFLSEKMSLQYRNLFKKISNNYCNETTF